MKNILLFIAIVFFSLSSIGQTIDSASIITHQSPPNHYIKITFTHLGYSLTDVEWGYTDYIPYVNYVFKECNGDIEITTFDTLFWHLGVVYPGFSNFVMKVSLDTNTVDTLNCPIRKNRIVTDSLFFGSPFSITQEINLNKELSIFPNPALNVFTMRLANAEGPAHFYLYNMQGQEIVNQMVYFIAGEVHIDVGNLPSGVYFICLNYEGVLRRTKLVIE